MSKTKHDIDWRREIRVGAAREFGKRHRHVILAWDVARALAPAALVALGTVVVALMMSQLATAVIESTLWTSLGVALAALVAGVVAWRRWAVYRGWYLGVAGGAVACLAIVWASLAGTTLVVWLTS